MNSATLPYCAKSKSVKHAGLQLITDNAEHLISYIYENIHRSPYDDVETRAGLAVKILLQTGVRGSSEILNPIAEDLNSMLNDPTHLQNESKRKALNDELLLINKLLILDEEISRISNVTVDTRIKDMVQDEKRQECTIM